MVDRKSNNYSMSVDLEAVLELSGLYFIRQIY